MTNLLFVMYDCHIGEIFLMLEKIKLVLADVDGTLLNTEKQVTEKTRIAISQLKDYGVQFGIATGRSPYAVERLVYEWGIGEDTDLIVGFNGSTTLDMHTKQTVSVFPLDGQAIRDIKTEFREFSFNIGVYDGRTYHVLFDDDRSRKTADANHFEMIVDDLTSYETSTVPKLLLTAEPEVITAMMEYYESNGHAETYHMFPSGKDRIEVINPELTKSRGISMLCEKRGLIPEEVMTFGDMMNDYEMIRDFTGVAMGNADDRVKQAAKYTTASNDEDGIAVMLEQLFQKKAQFN
jgi:Cof subfamily protein (haloacid dehalogenase superfamily)